MEYPKNFYDRYEELVISKRDMEIDLKLSKYAREELSKEREELSKEVESLSKKLADLNDIYMRQNERCQKIANLLDESSFYFPLDGEYAEIGQFIIDFKND